MSRAIQDSDDDDGDFDPPSPVSGTTPAPNLPTREASSRSQVTAPAGTSSTEVIQREIEAAHREVIEKSAAPTFVPPGTCSSPSMHRRNTMIELARSSSSTRNTHRRSTMVTYGSSGRRVQSAYEDEVFETMRDPGVVGVEAQLHSSPGDVEFVAAETNDIKPFKGSQRQGVIADSLEQDSASHEPAMFATSDTIPDGTLDIQQLYGTANAERMACCTIHDEAPSACESKELDDPSPPWSDFLHSPASAQAPKENTQVSPTHHSTPELESISRRLKSSSQPEHSQSVFQKSQSIFPQQGLSPASKRKRRTSISDTGPEATGCSPKRVRREPAGEADDQAHHDENSMTSSQKVDHSIQQSIRAIRASKAGKAQNNDSSEPLDSEDVLDGLPKERYLPRPSRSRSSRLAVEVPVDYTINPEKEAKQKVKGRKTEDVSTNSHPELSVAEKRQRMAEMGFSPNSAKRALKENENDLHRAIEELSILGQERATGATKAAEEINEMIDDVQTTKSPQGQLEEAPRTHKTAVVIIEKKHSSTIMDDGDASTNQTKRKRGRPPKARTAIVLDKAEDNAQVANVTLEAPGSQGGAKTEDHANMTLPECDEHRQNASSLKRRPSPTVNPTPPASARPVMTAESNELKERAAQIPEAQESLPKKRGRGRPRKHKSPEPTTMDRHEATNGDMQATRGADVPQSSESEETQKQTPEHGSIREAPVSTPLNVTSAEPRSALQTATASAQQAPESASAKKTTRSPAGKGKVPYRVGLSKRARIAPLLKIVKK